MGHVNVAHSDCVGKEALAALANQPLHRILASACPLCDYKTKLNVKLGTQGDVLIQPNRLRNHIARHMEYLALFVLPKYYPRQYDEPQLDDDDEPLGAGSLEKKRR
ncbi:hypothetical protein BDW74DRAFT_142831 [Aspergillus multicolor]|uniref:uncharacterized protein n=1 Tax=Aspergillus multicolor TaxID=41759 RepID=UPI003CCE1501